ncbi:polysaccharide biosynthesis C-terminal domain-containing protein, partial [bacterium]|nr:polysaccharide biosynthesis C-terminal domain-containing protein [bacterium]
DVFFCSVIRISEYVNILRLGFLIIVVQIIAMGFCRFYSAIKEVEFSNFIAFFNSGFWILLLLALWGIGVKITLPVFFLSWIIGSSISIILGLKKIGLGKFVKSEIDTSLVKKAFLFGTPLILSSVGYNLVSASSSFILSHYHTSGAAGVYFMAYRPLTAVYEFVTAVGMTVFVPYIIEAHNLRDMEKKNYYLSIMTKYTFITALPILTGILIGRADVIGFVTKSGYIDSAGIIPFVIIIPLLYIFIYPAHYELYLENKTLFIGIVYFAGGLLNVVLNILFIPKYSYYAAALSTVVSLLAVLIIFYIKTINILHLKWQFMKIGRIAAVSVISGIISYYLYGLFNTFSIEFVRLMSLGIVILLIYIPGLYLFSIFEERETNILKQFVRKMINK